jgi:hypothetical protein
MSTTWPTDVPTSDSVSGGAFEEALAGIALELCAVSELPAWTLPDGDVGARLAEALRVRAMLDELVGRLLATVEVRGVPTELGYSSLRAWLLAPSRSPSGRRAACSHNAGP